MSRYELPPIIKQLDKALEGQPDKVLTVLLILIGIFSIGVAFIGDATFKAVVAAWFIAP